MWDKLGNVNETVLANYLKNEYPQTVAVVLSKIKSEHAGRVLTQLPESFAMEVVMRMLRMEAVQKDVLDDVERTLRNEFMSNLARTNRRDAHEMIADIFNSLDRNSETRFLTALEERNRDSAERIKSLMFTFEDLRQLDGMAIQVLLRTPRRTSCRSRSRAPPRSCATCSSRNMSERAGKMLREEIAAWGRSGSRTSTRRRPISWRSPRNSPRAARSSSSTAAAKTSWCIEAGNGRTAQIPLRRVLRSAGRGARRAAQAAAAAAGAHLLRAELEAAREAGVAAGHAAALAEAAQSIEARAAGSLSSLALGLKVILVARQRYAEDARRSALDTLRAVIAKVVPALCRKAPLVEIETMVADCLREAFDEPRIVLRVADGLFETMRQRLEAVTAASGFPGKIVLLADETLGPGDARVEWAEGGAERDARRLMHEIDGALARALDSIPVPVRAPLRRTVHE